MRRWALWAVQSAFFPGYRRPPPPGAGAPLEALGVVELRTVLRSGRRLSVLRLSAAGGAESSRPQVVLVHPRSRRGKYFFATCDRARLHLEAGCDVWLMDLNGIGESERIDLSYASDVVAVAREAEAMGRAVVVHGVSFGSYQVGLSAPELPEGTTVILENCARSFYDGWKNWLLTRLGAKALLTLAPRWSRGFDLQHALERAANRQDLGWTVIASGDDALTPAQQSSELLVWLPGERQLFVIEGAPHLKAPMQDPDGYRRALASAWRRVGLLSAGTSC
ncbi:MAG: alpha/beta hydrolase [Planctomycetota bacterium]